MRSSFNSALVLVLALGLTTDGVLSQLGILASGWCRIQPSNNFNGNPVTPWCATAPANCNSCPKMLDTQDDNNDGISATLTALNGIVNYGMGPGNAFVMVRPDETSSTGANKTYSVSCTRTQVHITSPPGATTAQVISAAILLKSIGVRFDYAKPCDDFSNGKFGTSNLTYALCGQDNNGKFNRFNKTRKLVNSTVTEELYLNVVGARGPPVTAQLFPSELQLIIQKVISSIGSSSDSNGSILLLGVSRPRGAATCDFEADIVTNNEEYMRTSAKYVLKNLNGSYVDADTSQRITDLEQNMVECLRKVQACGSTTTTTRAA